MNDKQVLRHAVSVVAILSLTALGAYWAYEGVDRLLYVAILIVVGITGLGGYSLKKGDLPYPPSGGGEQ